MSSSFEEAKYYFGLGLILFEQGDYIGAEGKFVKALLRSPERLSILINLSATLIQLEKWIECEVICQKILTIEPTNYDALLNLGVCLAHNNNEAIALEYLDQAIEINSKSDLAWTNKGNIFQELNNLSAASQCFDTALSINPTSQEALIGRGNLRNELKDYQLALEDFDHVLRLNPSNANASWNKALSLLRLGNFKEGWALYESRWQISGMREHAKKLEVPLWLGKDSLNKKSILIHAEQGYGDTIQFSRYLPALESLGARVWLQTPKVLISLLQTLSPTIKIIESDKIPNERIDFHCPIMSLALAFGTTLETIPSQMPYLFADKYKRQIWRHKLESRSKEERQSQKPFRIGLTWVGSGHYAGKKSVKRDIPANEVKKLIDAFPSISIEFHSLQVERDVNKYLHQLTNGRLFLHDQSLSDFSDTAALISELDLIISIDTATAHLAGALNIPLIQILPDPPNFMSLLVVDKSPWYPSALLLRQTHPGDWSAPIMTASHKISKRLGLAVPQSLQPNA